MTTLWIAAVAGLLMGPGCDGAAPPGSEEPAFTGTPAVTHDAGTQTSQPQPSTDAGAQTAEPQSSSDGGTTTPSYGPDAGTAAKSCLASGLLADLGFSRMLVGADFPDTLTGSAPFDVRYRYLAGGISAGEGVCTSCTAACASVVGKTWWGCWQDTSLPPGEYLRRFLSKAADQQHLPLITYYQLLDATGVAEGAAEVTAMAAAPVMRRYFDDFRFMLENIGGARMLLHVEPDLWGYLQQTNPDPRAVPVAVATANETDCPRQENNAQGFGRCLIAMVRRYAPNAKVGLHASGWGTGVDALYNRDPAHDVTTDAAEVARFLTAVGPDADFVVVDPSDRDAGYFDTVGKNKWWDATDQSLPHFAQAFRWAKTLTETMQKPALWWQLPLGHMGLPNTVNRWRDNRIDTLFARAAEVAGSNAFGMVFGAGRADQTTPATDDGNLPRRIRAYVESGGVPACR